MITYTYNLDMTPGGVNRVVHLNQYDEDVTLVFHLFSSSGTFTIQSGTTAAIRGTKADGNGYSVAATISGNDVTVAVDKQMTAAAGRNIFELTLTKNDKELNSQNFIIQVERAALDKDTISNSVIRELISVIDRTDELIDAKNAMDQDVTLVAGYKSAAEQAASNASNSASAANDSASAAAGSAQSAQAAYDNLDAAIGAKKQAALNAIDAAYQEDIAAINARGAQIVAITTEADQVAAQALSTANNAQNHMASLDTQMTALEAAIQNVSIDPDDLGLYYDEDTKYLYPTYKDVVSENGIPAEFGGGGGGGGGDVISAVLTVENTSGWLSKTIATGSDCVVSFTWSSIEDEMPTGDGAIRITVNDIVRATMQIQQGNVSVNLKPYLSAGPNKVKVRISDTYDQGKTITFNITSMVLSMSSAFDASTPYNSTFLFPYVPVGAVNKTVYFIIDGQTIGTQETAVSNRELSYMIPAQTHGAHSLRSYFEASINGETVRSNELYYEFISIEPLNNTVIITSPFRETSLPQYTLIAVPFQVYNPASLKTEITISVNGNAVSTQTVDRSEQTFTYRANSTGNLAIVIACGNVTKTFSLTITESDIDVEPATEGLKLHLTAQGRSNNEEHPEVWTYGTGANAVAATLTGFNWTSDGWQNDEDGITCLRVSGSARVTIPYKLFETDARQNGMTVEIEFATRNVADYNATILSCISGNRGLTVTPQSISLKSDQTDLSMQYKDGEHIRVAYTVDRSSGDRLVKSFIDGIVARAVQYPVNDNFAQASPVNISIGSSDCTIDIYCIRVYQSTLTMQQVVENWIADTQNVNEMLDRYGRNAIYDEYGKVVIANLPSNIPYFILEAEELPQYKGDKKTISGSYTDPMHPSKSFTFTGMQINVQGTSSAPYYRKNFDMQYKEGFELTSGHADKYKLRDSSIATNRFVTKADVASSESANNTQLVRIYNDTCPYKTPEMVEDAKVRWGIDGFPIVIFWHDTATGQTTFHGKYNFNFPKRFPAGYGYTGNDESWEFQNNTSNLMLFLTDYFDETMYTDPETGDTKERWRYDYEARFPDDTWVDYSKLQILQSFIYSTYRAEATGDALPSPVTYDEVTYTNDTSAYRLAKFKAEFPSYAELNSFVFYYVFTEFFLMVDSRAKNLFIGFHGGNSSITGLGRKAVAEPYDMDTAMGTNNEGTLSYGYSLEDTDTISGANVFNGQNSVLWCNLRDAFPADIQRVYQTLRSSGGFNYDFVENRFEDAQHVWPEAIWNEDAQTKYFEPLISPAPGKEATDFYIPMCQGSKEQQRKQWLQGRFAYMDSKWNAGDALRERIQLRGYAKADITVTPYIDLYPTVKYGSYVVSARGRAGVPQLLECPIDTLNDTEIYIYSARNIASAGDLSGLKVGVADFSYATNIQEVKLGSDSVSYDNPNMKSISFGSNKLLKKVDVRNCSGLGTKEQKSVDMSGCEIIEEVYFEGTSIQGLTLPNGGVLKKLHLPSSITNLTVMNQRNLTEFEVEDDDYSNITTLRIENCNDEIPVLDILSEMPASSRVRLIGLTATVSSTDDVEDFYDFLDTMIGMDESGNNVEKAVVQGTISGLGTITGAWVAQMKARYPYIDFGYEHINANLKYYNGSTLLHTETIIDGGNGVWTGTASKSSTAQYTYTFAGWSKEDDDTVDSDARTAIVADRNVYACFTATTRTYTVTWKNADNTTLETDTNVPYGTIPTYNGATPTSTEGAFAGWDPPVGPISGDTTYKASFDIVIVEPDLKYLVYTTDDVNMTMTITGLNVSQILADNLAYITIPDTIQGYRVILG